MSVSIVLVTKVVEREEQALSLQFTGLGPSTHEPERGQRGPAGNEPFRVAMVGFRLQ